MKLSILAAVGITGLFSTSALHAQSAATTRRSFTNRPIRRPSTPAVAVAPRTDGVIARAVRSGQPLQMINPLAPAAYGSGSDTVRRETNDPYGRPQGIKLVSVEF